MYSPIRRSAHQTDHWGLSSLPSPRESLMEQAKRAHVITPDLPQILPGLSPWNCTSAMSSRNAQAANIDDGGGGI